MAEKTQKEIVKEWMRRIVGIGATEEHHKQHKLGFFDEHELARRLAKSRRNTIVGIVKGLIGCQQRLSEMGADHEGRPVLEERHAIAFELLNEIQATPDEIREHMTAYRGAANERLAKEVILARLPGEKVLS